MSEADPRLDRLVQFDERSREYPIRELLQAKKPRSYTWQCNSWLDQGQEGACVGFAWAHELAARPSAQKGIFNDTALAIYKQAKKLDQWIGENYNGTSIIAGIRAVQQFFPAAITEYRWGFGLNDLILTLGYHGPVVLGINWYQDMYRPDSSGFIRVSGGIAGGHAILARGVNIKHKRIVLHNSWGQDWGINGDCYVTFDDMDRLLHEDGEACVPVRREAIKK
jgi:hypothetical protein